MTFIGFDGIGYRTGLASSDNLVDWNNEGLLLDRGAKGSVTEFNAGLMWILRGNDLFGGGELRKVGGRYVATYQAYPDAGHEAGPGMIGICWSDDLHGWELDEPCLLAEDGDEWERAGLYKSCLVEHDGTYYMYYNAKNRSEGWIEQIGVATSKDLVRWERNKGNPIVPVGANGAFDDRFAGDPCVLKVGEAWAMAYYGLSGDGHARDGVAFSDDLLHWTKSGEVLVDVGADGAADSRYAHKPSLFFWEGVLYHFYCAVSPCTEGRRGDVDTNEVRGIAMAMSDRPA